MSKEKRDICSPYLVVLGSGYSGSGAVYEYLSGVDGFASTLDGYEFKLLHEPGGLNEFFEAISNGFHPNRADKAFQRFKALAYRCSKSRNSICRGLGYGDLIDGYEKKINSFLSDILCMSYEGLSWISLTDKTSLQQVAINFFRRAYSRYGIKKPCGTMYLPVDKERFADRAFCLINDLLNPRRDRISDANFLLVNQGGSFWHPTESTYFYPKRKVIVVTRDPRDIYTDLKTKGFSYPGNNVSDFCRWYSSVMKRRELVVNSGIVTEVSFERFVLDPGYRVIKLGSFLGSDLSHSTYNISRSQKNVGIYKGKLKMPEIREIENRLAEYMCPFK